MLDDALTVTVVGVEPPTLALVGELDFRTRRKVDASARSLGTRDRVIDRSGLTFLDSHGVSALVSLYQDREPFGARVVLTGLTGSPRRVLDMMALLDMFESQK